MVNGKSWTPDAGFSYLPLTTYRPRSGGLSLYSVALGALLLRSQCARGLRRQIRLTLGGIGHLALGSGQLAGLVGFGLGLFGGSRRGLALLLQTCGFFLGQLVLHALALQLATCLLGIEAAALQLDLVVLAVQLVEPQLRHLELSRCTGQIDLPLGDIQRVRAILGLGLGQAADRIAGTGLFGLGIAAEVRIVRQLVQGVVEPGD